MGEPGEPSDKQRAETRELAAAIVESVRADAKMPHGLIVWRESGERCTRAGDVEELAFRLAQEIDLLRTELETERRVIEMWRATTRQDSLR